MTRCSPMKHKIANFLRLPILLVFVMTTSCTTIEDRQVFGPQQSAERKESGPFAIEGMAALGGLFLMVMAVGVLARNACDAANPGGCN